jgi:methylated-DNA-protein-cysteine methyltransferase-like protein
LTGAGEQPTPSPKSSHAALWAVVRRVPAGRVATYGQIAAEVPGTTARMAGYALAALPDELADGPDGVPWHRIVNARGEISPRGAGDGANEQRARLEAEGVVFDAQGRIPMRTNRWRPAADL